MPRRIISRAASRAQRNVPVRFDVEHGVPLLERHVDEGASRWSPALSPGCRSCPRPRSSPGTSTRTSASRETSARMAMAATPAPLSSPTTPLGVLGPAHVVDDHVRARRGERPRDALADAGVGPGDERLLALERLVSRHADRPSRRPIEPTTSGRHGVRVSFHLARRRPAALGGAVARRRRNRRRHTLHGSGDVFRRFHGRRCAGTGYWSAAGCASAASAGRPDGGGDAAPPPARSRATLEAFL